MRLNVRQILQKKLDDLLLPYGILSSHLRRVSSEEIENSDIDVNLNEYVVYRIVSSKQRFYGDGKSIVKQTNFDINYYFKFDKNSNGIDIALDRIHLIENAFKCNEDWRLINGLNDLYDLENDYRGFNIEVAFLGIESKEVNDG